MNHKFKKILVTGGAGFIGSHVVDVMINAGYDVRILDSLEPPTHNGETPAWVNSRAEFVRGDVSKKSDWKKALEGVDAVIHLASYMDYHLDFAKYIRTNVESIGLLFELIVEDNINIKKIITASSQSVYGVGKYKCRTHGIIYPDFRLEEDLSNHFWEHKCNKCHSIMEPVEEKEDDLLNPQTPYGISKLASENLILNLGKRYGIPSVVLRYSIVLGARQSFRHFYSGALRAFSVFALNGEAIEMNEDAQQLRDFVDVRDVAEAHLKILEEDLINFEVFNIGSGKGTKVIDLAKEVAMNIGIEFNPSLENRYRVGDCRHSIMNIDKIKSIGWSPKVALRGSVKYYIDWIKQFEDVKKYLHATYDSLRKQHILQKK